MLQGLGTPKRGLVFDIGFSPLAGGGACIGAVATAMIMRIY